jgi:V/A-type H+-transporting ATPase subunit I
MRLSPLGRDPETMIEELRNYLQQGGFLLFISGISSTIFGVFFWSFAGMHGHGAPSFMQEGGLLYFLKPLHLWSNDSFTYDSFAGATGTFLFLQLSLVIGIIHISLALFMLFLNKLKHRDYMDAIFFPGMLLVGYISAALLVFSYGLDIFGWFTDPGPYELDIAVLTPIIGFNTGLFIPGPIVFLIMTFSFLIFIIYSMITHGVTDGFSEGLDFTLSLLGNSVSYARLFAINIVHSILSLLLYSALSLEERVPFDTVSEHGAEAGMDIGGEIIILIAFIIGTLIVMTFELMVTFLQTLRLHIVEFFSKMHFSGSGREFDPFISQRIYTEPVSIENQSIG